jgi:hypothetical protein
VVPVDGRDQRLMLVRRDRDGLVREWREPVRFVPLVKGA